MLYEDLLIESDGECLTIKEKPLSANLGRIKGTKIAIRKNMNTASKACILAEELGHYYTSTGNILNQDSVANRKQEKHARQWAHDKMIGLKGIVCAYKYGCTTQVDIAEYLEVTDEFLKEALQDYQERYGIYSTVDNYVIFFEPLGVLELYK